MIWKPPIRDQMRRHYSSTPFKLLPSNLDTHWTNPPLHPHQVSRFFFRVGVCAARRPTQLSDPAATISPPPHDSCA